MFPFWNNEFPLHYTITFSPTSAALLAEAYPGLFLRSYPLPTSNPEPSGKEQVPGSRPHLWLVPWRPRVLRAPAKASKAGLPGSPRPVFLLHSPFLHHRSWDDTAQRAEEAEFRNEASQCFWLMRWLDSIIDSVVMSLSKLGSYKGQASLACGRPRGHKE